MFDEIKDFIAKHKIWFIICGIIFALAGAVMAALISLYFLIAVAVGLIVAVASGFMKNKEIKGTIIEKKYEPPSPYSKNENQKTYALENGKPYNQNEAAPPISETPTAPTLENKEELEKYKQEARERITKEYVQGLLKSVEEGKEINESEDMCSSLFKKNGIELRGDDDAFKIIKSHFSTIEIKNISKNFETAIRGDIEVLFEVLTGCEYETAGDSRKKLAVGFKFESNGHGCHGLSKCFFEHTILCALEICKNQGLLKLYTDEKTFEKTSTRDKERQKRPLLQFYDWDADHKHGSVLKQPKTDTSLDPNQLE